MNIALIRRITVGAPLLAAAAIFCGCASISENTHAYLGSPRCAPTNPDAVKIFTTEPEQSKEQLGEIILSVEGNPSRQRLEGKLKTAGAQLGATGVFIVSDQTKIQPVLYWDWWGPVTSEDWHRLVVAVAFKNK